MAEDHPVEVQVGAGSLKHLNAQKIEQEIEKFESQVDFEFIPVIAKRSSYVDHIPWALSLLLILVFITIGQLILNHFLYNAWYDQTFFYIAAIIISIILSRVLSRLEIVQRLFITEKERQRQVHEKAQMIFFNQRLSHIQSRNALLVFISIMERRIEIIPDPNIQLSNIGAMTQELLKLLQDEFKEQKYEQGFIEVIQYMQSQLKNEFPRKNSGENVVSNKLIWWQD